ncbi:MAG: hypothetical protein J7M25_00825 [Deltaproteobacteria bacterium]|nr:hypothetical protein [Deltaproteobacteria bacterium]
MMHVVAMASGSILGAGILVLGLVVAGLALRWMMRAEGMGKKVTALVTAIVGLGLVGGGGWYGLVGYKMSKVENAKHREAGQDVKTLIGQFGHLLTTCRDQVFPNMPYKPSEQAKEDKYVTAIKVMQGELLNCYTGSKGVGEEKGAELDQIKWLVADKTCAGFADRLIKKRTFCPQMIESLIGKAHFIDPLAAAEGQGDTDKKDDPAKVAAGITKLVARINQCHKDVLSVYVAPKDKPEQAAVDAAVAATGAALKACAAGKGGEELGLKDIDALLKVTDCKQFAKAYREMSVCSPALEAPMKAGWAFAQQGSESGAGKDETKAPVAGRAGGMTAPRVGARPVAQPRKDRAAVPRPR